MSDLKTCPFCDGPAKIISGFGQKHSFTATCDSLDECLGQHMEQDEQGGFTADYRTEEDAITAWNTRAAPKVKPLVWKETWEGSNEDIPGWQADNELGLYVGFSFAGIYKLKKHSDAPPKVVAENKLAREAGYERRILSALTPETET